MPSALSTDLYELAMIAGYYAERLDAPATFELSVRRLPDHRNFLVVAGLEQALDYLEQLRFTSEQIAYVRAVPQMRRVPEAFFDKYLAELRFTGEVWAMPEGTPAFGGEPLLRVTAPIGEAQLIETALLATLAFQTTIASKAIRVVGAAKGRPVMEFGTRRAHGSDAGLFAARAAYIAGCAGTSNVEAGFRFRVPVSGTMAHSWVMAHENERVAFQRFSALYGSQAILLIDTYDSLAAVRQIAASGLRPSAVRLDSGNVEALSREVRSILDRAGLHETTIFASGDLDEYRVAGLVDGGAPVDGFGVGTALSTSIDAPALGAIYKIVEIDRGGRRVPTIKMSADKPSAPGRKQVWRTVDERGIAVGDHIALHDESGPAGAFPLLERVMANGRRLAPAPTLEAVRTYARDAVAKLPASLRELGSASPYRVLSSATLETLTKTVEARLRQDRQ